MNKLSPKLKLGCSKCGNNGLDLDLDNTSVILSKRESRVTSVIIKSGKTKSSKVVSLF